MEHHLLKGRGVYLSWSLLCPECLEQDLVYSSCSKNICRKKERREGGKKQSGEENLESRYIRVREEER